MKTLPKSWAMHEGANCGPQPTQYRELLAQLNIHDSTMQDHWPTPGQLHPFLHHKLEQTRDYYAP